MSYNKSIFQGVPKKNVNKSRFNLSHEYKAQMPLAKLIPILILECLPQDEWSIDSEFMFRFAPLYFPIMQKITMRADYYYIPNRILWTENSGDGNPGWAKWIANHEDAEGVSHPTTNVNMSAAAPGYNMMAYMGIPEITPGTGITTTITNLNALPLSAILKIWDEYYRIPQLEDEIWFALGSGDNTAGFIAALSLWPEAFAGGFPCIPAKWEKDYFTSALPTPQIGDAIQIPMVSDPFLHPNGVDIDGPFRWRKQSDDTPAAGASNVVTEAGSTGATNVGGVDVYLDVQETAATIKQLRIAEVLQSYYERIMKVGQRYRDFIEGLWGNDPQPGDVDVPVLLGSRFGRVQIADVMTQALTLPGDGSGAQTGDYQGQANLYANDGEQIRYRSNEHGWLICILQLNANTGYGQGIERFWRREIQTDYPLDMFAGIGDQEILKEEVLYNAVTLESGKNVDTFGYIPRFSEMRWKSNIHVGGLNYGIGLSQHMNRWWDPSLMVGAVYDDVIEINRLFTESGNYLDGYGETRVTDTFRVLNVKPALATVSEATVFAHIFHNVYVNRALPMFSTPKSI